MSGLSKGTADDLKALQVSYLSELNKMIKKTLNPAIEKRRQSIIKEFNININFPGRVFTLSIIIRYCLQMSLQHDLLKFDTKC